MDSRSVTDRMLRQPVYGIGFALLRRCCWTKAWQSIVFLPVESCLAYRFCIFGGGCALGYFPCALAKAVSELAGWH